MNLSSNQLKGLPEEIFKLCNLQSLDLSNNQLKEVPEAIASLQNLQELYLHGNDALGIPAQILGATREEVVLREKKAAKPADILDYYFRTHRLTDSNAPQKLNEAKVILVGFGNVGKTSLVSRLTRDYFKKGEAQTEGIAITPWEIILNGNESIRLNVWDFGGQEIMHSTHQFFLTERTLYLLVLNGRQGHEDADAEYWLELLASSADDSPVIIVLNKIKERHFDLNRRALRQKYPNNIKKFVETDCEDNTGLPELRHLVETEVDALPDVRSLFPGEWFRIKNRLAAMPADHIDYIDYRRYIELCAECGETNPESQDRLARFLHALGIALNYKDDPRLRDTNILNPNWLTGGVYAILNDSGLATRYGNLTHTDLDAILDPARYPRDRHNFLLDIMRKFELCFRYPEANDSEDRFLLPQLLGKEQPEEAAAFDPRHCLNFQYRYPILPEGIVPRFIVRTHPLSAKTPELRWRSGVILNFEGNRALVKGDRQAKTVTINIDGPAPGRRNLLAIIRSDFERIHADFEFDPQEIVPLAEHPGGFVPYRLLLDLKRQGIRENHTLVDDNRAIPIDIEKLLGNLDLETMSNPLNLFYSYSHKDETYKDELETHLKLMQRRGLIAPWSDRRILGGDEWKNEIDQNLEEADIILLLISADFIASDYCFDIEMKRAIERHNAGQARVIPIIVRDVDWHDAPFSKLQALPKDGKAVALWEDKDSAWRNVSEGIKAAISAQQNPTTPAPAQPAARPSAPAAPPQATTNVTYNITGNVGSVGNTGNIDNAIGEVKGDQNS